jgi:excisionase family DNA binding protein
MGLPALKEEISLEQHDQKVLNDLLNDDSLELTKRLREMLSNILEQSSSGNTLTIVSSQKEFTTQEAADILRVSRMYLIKLLDEKKIPHRLVGAHRRVLAFDLMAYKKKFDFQREKALEDIAKMSQEIEEDY